MKHTIIAALTAAMLMLLNVPALAEDGAQAYGFSKGQQENAARHSVYAQLEGHDGTIDKSGYTDSHASGTGSVSVSDAETLIEAGVIDQETADRIAAYAASRHEQISAIYSGIGSLSPAERSEAFAQRKSTDGSLGASLDELVEAGILTQEQADAIGACLNP